MSSLGLRPWEDIQLPSGTYPIHLETHGTNITCQYIVCSFFLLVGTRVRKENFPELSNLLSPVMDCWDLLVQQIGVPLDQISQIKLENPQSGTGYLYRCFTQSLKWWVDNHDSPVYESIIDILDPGSGKITPVMNKVLAGELKQFVTNQRGELLESQYRLSYRLTM